MLDVSELTCGYGARRVVSDVTFSVSPKKIMGLLGPNGAGKTTTMKAVCGLLEPLRGNVIVNGRRMHGRNARARAAIGYLPEHPPLYSDLTVGEYLRFCTKLRGIPRGQQKNRIDDVISMCALQSVQDRVIGRLSKGYQQRVGFAQALVHQPSLVVLDEPMSGLDPNQIREMRVLIRELGAKTSVLLSSHILAEVEAVCDEVVLLSEGRVALNAPVDSFAAAETDVQLAVSWRNLPSMDSVNTLPGMGKIQIKSGNTLLITTADPDLATRSLLEATLANGWELENLTHSRRSLEEIFVAITKRPNAPQDVPP